MIKTLATTKRIVGTLAVTAMLLQQTAMAQNKVSIIVTGTSLEVVYNGKTRFAGGKPQIQNKVNSLKNVVAETNTFIYKFDQSYNITTVFTPEGNNIWGMKLSLPEGEMLNGKEFTGFFFDEISGYNTGVEIWMNNYTDNQPSIKKTNYET